MAKKSAKSDRQAVIDELRKKQKGAERRRGWAIVGVCVLVAALIVGAAAYRPIKNWWDLRKYEDLELSAIGSPASVCGEITTKPAEGSSDHVPQPQQVTYTTAPPAYGQHWNEAGVAPAPFNRKFYTSKDRPELEALVHNLEHGYTILWYDETVADDSDQMNELRAIADKFAGTSNLRFKFKAVPWLESDGKSFPEGQHIAFTHWSIGGADQDPAGDGQVGVWQYCTDVSGDALNAFMLKYPYMDSPEPTAM